MVNSRMPDAAKPLHLPTRSNPQHKYHVLCPTVSLFMNHIPARRHVHAPILRTRKASLSTLPLSGLRLMTQFDTTTSTDSSYNQGSNSALALRLPTGGP